MDDNKRLADEIAVVTGSNSGIGQATAIAFGWRCVSATTLFIDGVLMQSLGQGA